MIEPIRLAFEVACPADHAFAVWTGRIGQWWPADHTVSGEPGLAVVLEPRPGGRIFERTAAGVEHDWGEVTVWEPPSRFVYLWHIRRDRADATEVEIRFAERGRGDDAGRDRASRLGGARRRGRVVARSQRRRLGDPAAALHRGRDAGCAAARSSGAGGGCREGRHVREGRVGRRLGRRRRTAARSAVAAVDPDRREAQPLGRDVVVEQALGDVEDPLARQPDPLEGDLEVVLVGLVAPGLLGGHDPVERRAEARRGSGEQVVIAVGDDAEPEALVEPRQGRRRIGEGRPVADRIGERRDLGSVGLDAVVGGDPAQAAAEDLAVAQVRARLGGRFDPGERLEQLVVGGLDAARSPATRRRAGEDARPPSR